jgi:hypothetical protein
MTTNRNCTLKLVLAPCRVGFHCCMPTRRRRTHLVAVSYKVIGRQSLVEVDPAAHKQNKAIHWQQILMRRLAERFSLGLNLNAGLPRGHD